MVAKSRLVEDESCIISRVSSKFASRAAEITNAEVATTTEFIKKTLSKSKSDAEKAAKIAKAHRKVLLAKVRQPTGFEIKLIFYNINSKIN